MERSAIRDRRRVILGFRGACHRARIRATRWLHPGYDVRQRHCEFVGWVESAKPIISINAMMGIAALHPSYALHLSHRERRKGIAAPAYLARRGSAVRYGF